MFPWVIRKCRRSKEPSFQTEHPSVGLAAGLAAGKVVEGHTGGLNQVPRNERRSLGRALFRAFDAALPFQHRPAVVPRFREQRKNPLKINLTISDRAEPSRALRPRLVSAV